MSARRFEKIAPKRSPPVGPTTHVGMTDVTAALIRLDEAVSGFATVWGAGRLVRLCRDDARAGFRRGYERLHHALDQGDVQAVQATVNGLIKTWQIADRQARADGHQELAGDVWEAVGDDGRVIALCRTNADAAACLRSGRAMVAYSMAEIVRLLPKLDLLGAIKTEFPGAVVERVTPQSEGFAESWATVDPLHELLHGEEGA